MQRLIHIYLEDLMKAVGLLESEGYQVSFKDFMRIGVPYTLVAVIAGYIFIWVVWS